MERKKERKNFVWKKKNKEKNGKKKRKKERKNFVWKKKNEQKEWKERKKNEYEKDDENNSDKIQQ